MTAPERHEIRIGDAGYPEQLLRLDRPPRVLRCIGDPTLLAPGLAIVGSRRQTPYGRECAFLFARWAARRGITVISGAAVGCDQTAHRTAIENGGATVAVLGCGADIDYPRSARPLLESMRRDHLVVSELEWGTQPARWHFPERNRIIAGLAAAVLVVEASLPSGTFSTADHAMSVQTDVLAVPGSILSPQSRGTNRLIRDGAGLVADVDDLEAALAAAGLTAPRAPSRSRPCHVSAETEIERILAAAPMHLEDLAREIGADTASTACMLGELELSGRIARGSDGRYHIAANTAGR